LGELAPKRIAMQKCEAISFKVVGVLLFVRAITRPFIKVLSVSTNLVVRMLGFDPNASEEVVTEEEIRILVDAGEEKGVIEESQKEMINNIFDFDDIPVSDVMTHRTEIEAVEITDKIEDVVKLSCENGYSRIPVYEETLDKIIGVLYAREYLLNHTNPKYKLENAMFPPKYVPETMHLDALLKEMQDTHNHIAIVVNEYGVTSGVVSMEDIIEELVGEIWDESDEEILPIKEIGDDTTCCKFRQRTCMKA
jgi:putative hemolysin